MAQVYNVSNYTITNLHYTMLVILHGLVKTIRINKPVFKLEAFEVEDNTSKC